MPRLTTSYVLLNVQRFSPAWVRFRKTRGRPLETSKHTSHIDQTPHFKASLPKTLIVRSKVVMSFFKSTLLNLE